MIRRALFGLLLAAASWSARAGGSARRFEAGMKALAAERFDEAVAAFWAILVDRPSLVRVCLLELARAFFLEGEEGLARRHFKQVLAGDVHTAVATNVYRFLGAIRAPGGRWETSFGMVLAPDSNLNATPVPRTIWMDTPFGRLPLARREERAEVRPRAFGLGRRGIPASALAAAPAVLRSRRLGARILERDDFILKRIQRL